MTVGGRIIEIKRVTQRDADNPDFSRDAIQIWVVDLHGDETIVFAKPQDALPNIGDDIWWQARKIFFDGDKKFLWKLGYSTGTPSASGHQARRMEG